ncbi:hypothetical protein SSBR45G_70520 [Bradyrhizobium sp. SSBR45G]|uniref:hypothetical protein n=1 Tax=unclassified Bradyrhizobium TaxID=2631580 RepID=UPI0023429D45|nr:MULTISPECIES: hypothetical protein [unclassified Bradyrhizobium]GLH82143.1 hypothetical protein SSBR45G_70520 [Bradyrhizobium sp. SSBR45G]GLH89570.1 hypothetical protein SSBR45R_70310 [Bradyrhizobium sp. SSBR45R]
MTDAAELLLPSLLVLRKTTHSVRMAAPFAPAIPSAVVECTVAKMAARVFPIRLKPDDWASGDTHWLLDVSSPSKKAAIAVLANFKQVVKDKPIRIHPIVSQLVDPDVLERMKVRTVGQGRISNSQ